MVAGISVSNIDLFIRSPSRLLHPSRMTNDTNLLLFNSEVTLGQPSDKIKAIDFANNLPDAKKHFDIRMTNSTMNFEDFYDYTFLYGRAHRGEMPYMYGAYHMY